MVKIQLIFRYSEFHVNYFTIFSLITTLSTDVHIKPTDGHQYLYYSFSHPEQKKDLLYLPTLYMSVKLVLVQIDFEIIPCK